MAKKVHTYIKLEIKAKKANPSPPIGPALGQHGVNIMSFCKSFNEKTKSMEEGSPIPVVITVYSDKSFSFIMKTLPTSFLIKQKISAKKGSANAKTEIIGTITKQQLEEIAKIKAPDLNANSIEAAVKTIIGSAKSMGVKIDNIGVK